MSSRTSITAALAMAAVTILAVAACGSSVTGSAQANSAAVLTTTTPSTESTSEISLPSELTDASALPTDLSELTSLLDDLPTDLSLPSDLSDLTNLDIPGYNGACLSVGLAYAAILIATYPTILGGSESFDATELEGAIKQLSGQVPPEIAGDIEMLSQIAAQANGKSLTEVGKLFESDEFTAATKHVEDWTTANCHG